ncbi:MAG: outer membrane beta-barrel protein [Beijerinckiaceae bacterium]
MRITRLALLAAVAAVTGTSAYAADLPARKEAPMAPLLAPAPAYTWGGFYVGLQAGVVWDRITAANNGAYAYLLAPTFPIAGSALWWGYNSGASTKSGFVGGGHVGYNWQMNSFVLGAEGDIEGASVWSGSYRASLRGRLGFAIDRTLVYATGGVAFSGRSGSSVTGYYGYNWGANTTSSRTGWTVGGGVEYLISPNWSAGLEYRYTQFSGNTGNTGYFGYNWGGNIGLIEQALRARVSYHFAQPSAPVLARY